MKTRSQQGLQWKLMKSTLTEAADVARTLVASVDDAKLEGTAAVAVVAAAGHPSDPVAKHQANAVVAFGRNSWAAFPDANSLALHPYTVAAQALKLAFLDILASWMDCPACFP